MLSGGRQGGGFLPRGLRRDDATASDMLQPTIEPNSHVDGSFSSHAARGGFVRRGGEGRGTPPLFVTWTNIQPLIKGRPL